MITIRQTGIMFGYHTPVIKPGAFPEEGNHQRLTSILNLLFTKMYFGLQHKSIVRNNACVKKYLFLIIMMNIQGVPRLSL